ncbi:MAG: 30S ribosomal protein S12 methylthiotransferase RimO [Clostridia bacterium]|nr:30S ribosomal protein S12 methylthiotransferase RimO [Clostridia bacterium]
MKCRIALMSLGCAKNQTDGEIMLGLLADNGYEIVPEPDDAEVIIVNTCGFIESAKQESINAILQMAEYKNNNCKLLIATGCLAERYKDDILLDLPEVDAILGTGDYDRICDAIESTFAGEKYVKTGEPDRNAPECLPRILSTPPYTAYLKIAEGCSNNCTYCAIPMIRGKFRSRRIEDIVNEARTLSQNGVKELIVIAQDTTRYGTDIYGRPSLDKLLCELVKIDGIEWIRLHYFYAEAVTDELVKVMAKYDKICSYIDMPIQHASNKILRRMARRTTKEEMTEKITAFRNAMPDCTIRTSVIVGFPGETEEDFRELYEFVRETEFDRLGVFAYSQEEGTPAAKFEDQISEDIKAERLDKIMTLQQGISYEKNKAKLGKVIDVIVEGYDEDNFLFYGRSKADSIEIDGLVYFATEDEVDAGDIIKVKILDADEYDLTGTRV